MKPLLNLLVTGAFAAFTSSVMAADDNTPVIHRMIFPDNSVGVTISDNGKWAVAGVYTSVDAPTSTGHIFNVDADTYEDMPAVGTVSDITDDGNLVVGSHNGRPAYWTRSDNKWHTLSIPAGWSVGHFNAVTPDGRYAVGTFSDETLYYERGVMWDLQENREVVLTNLPQYNMLGTYSGETRYTGISADGRYVLVTIDFAYLEPAELCSFVYDVQTQNYRTIGFIPHQDRKWEPLVEGTYFIDMPVMSPSGEWVTGTAYMVFDDDPQHPTQYNAVFRLNVYTGDYEVFDGAQGEYYAFAVSDDGVVYGSSPTSSPLREWSVRHGNNWVPIDLIAEQRYGVNFEQIASFERTGSANSVSADGRRMLTLIDPVSESAVIEFSDPLGTLCEGINLLTNYMPVPAAGSEFPRLTDVSITFDQKIQFVGNTNDVQLVDADGAVKRSSNNIVIDDNPQRANITFRGINLDAGAPYEVVIPAGTFAMANDATMKNTEIRIPYTGRANVPVSATEIYPAAESTLVKIDNTESPIIIKFDSRLKVAAGASAKLTLVEDESETPLCSLIPSVDGNNLYLYPATMQYLYSGSHYRVDLPAGVVTDVVGYGGNEALSFNYEGGYVREISSDDTRIFSCDFNNVSNSLATFLLYEGDHNTPDADMVAVGFDTDNTPWNFSLRETLETNDYFAASHSSYVAGSKSQKSDDWMMIPRLYIPDEWCQLDFDAQRYHASAKDHLKVLVWESDDIINTLTPSIMERVKAEAVTVFEEQIPSGATDEGTTGEWQHYTVNLPAYSGKNIYIAFLNDNEGQSAVFLDNVSVTRNMKFLVSLNVPETVVGRRQQMISGSLLANSDNENVNKLSFVLRDGEGNVIDNLESDNLNLKKGESQNFTFFEALPLTVGQSVPFSIDITVNDIYHETVKSSIKDLAFSPTKRVVIEEMTGLDCGNCPLGIIAFDYLERLYGDQVIPVSIHTYPGDPFGAGLQGYTDYLNILGAPSGQVNRSGDVVFPIWQNTTTGAYQYTNDVTHDTWLDCVQHEFQLLAEADLNIKADIDIEAGTMSIPVEVTYALDADNLHLNLLAVVLEDQVGAYQQNYFASVGDPLFGEWTGEGIYASQYVRPYIHKDVVRQVIGTTYAGTGGLLPQSMKAGEPVTTTITSPLPANLSKRTNSTLTPYDYAKVVVMLINADNGRVINVARTFLTDTNYLSGISAPALDSDFATIYDLSGRRLSVGQTQTAGGKCQPGLYIVNGRKVMVK